MSDPTPFPTDPLEPEGTDPDLSKDAQENPKAPGIDSERGDADQADADRPDDRAPTFEERQQDRTAAEVQDKGDTLTDIP